MNEELKPGDTVMIKSGGPLMTVKWVDDNYGTLSANCDWFDVARGGTKKENETFPVTSLRKTE